MKPRTFTIKIRTWDTLWSRVLVLMKQYYMIKTLWNFKHAGKTRMNSVHCMFTKCPDDSSTSQSNPNVSEAVRFSQPSFHHASSLCSENSSVDFCLWNSSANATKVENDWFRAPLEELFLCTIQVLLSI